ncbi:MULTISPECIES: transposase [Candidatus Rhabdochlamydia]|uniref:transposase n=1 Tax=Candidatus Rhabdochlamydia TaxID=292833 RepID=UPI0021111C90|nr:MULTISPECIES: transposase [Rhabdochlamydia]
MAEAFIIAPFCYTGTCNTDLFNTWLEKMLLLELKADQVIIMDNASFHNSQLSLEMIKKAGCEVLFLPPYSPDLNPIEIFWANFKRKVQSTLNTFSTLSEAIDQAILEKCA